MADLAPISSSKLLSKTVYTMALATASGSKLGMMIGTSSGAKRNKLTGFFKNIAYYHT